MIDTSVLLPFFFMFYFRSGSRLNSLGKPSDGFPQGGCNVSVIIQFHTYYISSTGFTSPFPHLFSIFRENKCLVRSGYEFVTILHFGSRLVLDQSRCVRAQYYTIFRVSHRGDRLEPLVFTGGLFRAMFLGSVGCFGLDCGSSLTVVVHLIRVTRQIYAMPTAQVSLEIQWSDFLEDS